MKKALFLVLMLIASVAVSAKEIPAGYVDLGLPSGTLWKAQNEPGQYMALTAKYRFEQNLPTDEQFYELRTNCSWKLLEGGYRVTGPNGNKIYFPFDGYLDCEEDPHYVGEGAFIWIRDIGERYSSFYVITENQKGSVPDSNCRHQSVRLVIDGNK